MATDAILILEQLRCIRESDGTGHSEPYIWPVFILLDDATNATGHVHVAAPALGSARIIIKNDMRRGQTADIPGEVGILRFRVDDNQQLFQLILIVALWENDETPVKAMRAGFQAFVEGLRQAFDERLGFLVLANTPENLDPLIEDITTEVKAGVESAIRGALTGSQKFRVKIGTLNLDDFIDSSVRTIDELQSKAIALSFRSGENPPSDRYTITGRLQTRRVIVDRCASLVQRVADAQAVVNGLEDEIKSLQDQLNGNTPDGEPTLPKSFLTEEIRRIREEELQDAEEALDDARAALQACRARPTRISINLDNVLVATRT
jgi:hypothetical protein